MADNKETRLLNKGGESCGCFRAQSVWYCGSREVMIPLFIAPYVHERQSFCTRMCCEVC